jgi:hypothetical protein
MHWIAVAAVVAAVSVGFGTGGLRLIVLSGITAGTKPTDWSVQIPL